MNIYRTFISVSSIVFCFLLALPVFAQQETTELPTGEEILERHIKASGGQEAFDKINNRYFESTIEIVGSGITLNAKTWVAKPNKVISTITSEALGTIFKGCTGEAIWSHSDLQGPVLESGAALENQLRDSTLDRLIYWKSAYQSAKCLGVDSVNEKKSYKLVLTPKPYQLDASKDAEISLMTVYFDCDSYLVSKIESNLITEAGTIAVKAFLSDYKEVDDIKIACRTDLKLAGQSRVIQIQSIKHNVELKPDQFDPPVEIKKLIDKSKAKGKQ